MTEIIPFKRFEPIPTPDKIEWHINVAHRGASMLKAICRDHLHAFTRRQLMQIGNFTETSCGGPLCAITAFQWWIQRINDRLPRGGWYIAEVSGTFYLRRIEADHARRLQRQLNGVMA